MKRVAVVFVIAAAGCVLDTPVSHTENLVECTPKAGAWPRDDVPPEGRCYTCANAARRWFSFADSLGCDPAAYDPQACVEWPGCHYLEIAAYVNLLDNPTSCAELYEVAAAEPCAADSDAGR